MADRIAVVGMSCRTPGAATYADLWTLLLEGRVVVGPWPRTRRRLSGVWSGGSAGGDDRYDRLDRVMTGGYLDDVAGFDAALFGISARVAAAIDREHRALLEAAWSALQDAGLNPRALTGSLTGDYAGLS